MRRAASLLAAVAALLLIAACSGSGSDSPDSAPSGTPAPSASSSPSGGSSASSGDVVADPPSRSWQDALGAARGEFSGDVSKIELESQEGGGLEYKIELMSADTTYAVQYDAQSLEKISEEREDLDDDAAEKRRETFDPATVVDLEQAADTARGEEDGAITKWKIEGEDSGRVQYEFDILPAGASEDVEVHVDAVDGSVVQDS